MISENRKWPYWLFIEFSSLNYFNDANRFYFDHNWILTTTGIRGPCLLSLYHVRYERLIDKHRESLERKISGVPMADGVQRQYFFF